MKKYLYKYEEDGVETEREIEADSISDGLVKLIEITKGNKLEHVKVYSRGEIKNDNNKKSTKRTRKSSK